MNERQLQIEGLNKNICSRRVLVHGKYKTSSSCFNHNWERGQHQTTWRLVHAGNKFVSYIHEMVNRLKNPITIYGGTHHLESIDVTLHH